MPTLIHSDTIAIMVDNVLLGWARRDQSKSIINTFKNRGDILSTSISVEGHELRIKTKDPKFKN